MLWRFSTSNTHLFPGALLRSLDAPDDRHWSSGDDLLLEFSDGVLVSGRLIEVDPRMAVLQMPDYRTRRDTNVAARTWRAVPGGEPGLVRVQERLAAA
ncbi:MAG: hypothetical protein QM674_23710 [Burkholderiaceae bacterium]